MSKKLFSVLATFVALIILFFSIRVSAVVPHSPEPYTKGCPIRGESQTQVVGCASDFMGYTTAVGCCIGGSNCYIPNPCGEGAKFQCGTWCRFQ